MRPWTRRATACGRRSSTPGDVAAAAGSPLGLSPAALPQDRQLRSTSRIAVGRARRRRRGAADRAAGLVLLGELGLDGRVRPVRGVLPALLAAARAGFRGSWCRRPTSTRRALVPGLDVSWCADLRRAASPGARASSRASRPVRRCRRSPRRPSRAGDRDLADVAGQHEAGARSRSPPPAATTCS